MGFDPISAIAGAVEKGFAVFSEFVEDKDKRNELMLQAQNIVTQEIGNMLRVEVEAQRAIIVAEAQGQSWMQRNWRPILMLVIVSIVANNYLVYPYLSLFTEKALVLELPDMLWSLMQIGVGGYIVTRSAEKIIPGAVQAWKGGGTK